MLVPDFVGGSGGVRGHGAAGPPQHPWGQVDRRRVLLRQTYGKESKSTKK